MKYFIFFIIIFYASLLLADPGVLILAHGSMQHDSCDNANPTPWEKNVLEAVEEAKKNIDKDIAVAFGMWNTKCFNAGIARLKNLKANHGRELTKLFVFPLFISDFSLVIEAQKFIFRLRQSNPLPFPLKQIEFSGEVQYLSAINYDGIISQIVTKRAKELIEIANTEGVSNPNKMELNIVMHGPIRQADNHRWLEMGHRYASDLSGLGFNAINVVSLQDDAEPPIRNRATALFRHHVQEATSRNHVSLVLPLLISRGGIESGIQERLKGLKYIWADKTIFPDTLLTDFFEQRIE